MRIFIGHNQYKIPGGEDAVVKTENQLLLDSGEETYLYERSNTEFDSCSAAQKIKRLRELGWSPQTYREVRDHIKQFRPDVAHFHNIFYAISPAAYSACKDEGIPVIQSLHNFRLLCSNGLLYRNGKVCEDCLEKSLWQGVYHGCFRNSRLLTGFVAAMTMKHWEKGTWQNMVDMYIMATAFGRQKLITKGLAPEKIAVKPNFVHPDPGIRLRDEGYVLYVGRLSDEKGIKTLLEAWESLTHVPLRIIGDGPLTETLRATAKKRNMRHVEFLGYVNQRKYEENMKGAKFLVVPSQCYENFPRIVVESFSYGVPVIASDIGSLKDLVVDGVNGLHFEPKNSDQLANKVKRLFSDQNLSAEMGKNARRIYEEKYNAQSNYRQLINIYQRAIKSYDRTLSMSSSH